jgi:hypothetical protein
LADLFADVDFGAIDETTARARLREHPFFSAELAPREADFQTGDSATRENALYHAAMAIIHATFIAANLNEPGACRCSACASLLISSPTLLTLNSATDRWTSREIPVVTGLLAAFREELLRTPAARIRRCMAVFRGGRRCGNIFLARNYRGKHPSVACCAAHARLIRSKRSYNRRRGK